MGGGRSPTIAVLATLSEIDAIGPEWEALARRTPEATAFQSYAWCRHWLAAAADVTPGRVAPRIVTVRHGGRLVMLWPLQRVSVAGLRLVRWVGEPLTQYGDALAEHGADRSSWCAAAEAAMRGWRDVDLVLLKRQRAEGVLASCAVRGMILPDTEIAPYIDFADPAAATAAASVERGMRRRGRRLAAQGDVGFESPAGPDSRVAMVREALRLKSEWLAEKRLFSRGLSHPVSRPFLERLAMDGALEIGVLTVGGTVAAVELGLTDHGAYRSLLGAYALDRADGAPGHALTSRLISAAKARGCARFDFMAPADAYKTRWTTRRTRLRSVAMPLTGLGRLGLLAFRMRPWLKRGARPALALGSRLRNALGPLRSDGDRSPAGLVAE